MATTDKVSEKEFKEGRVLYVLTDKINDVISEYFENCGIYVEEYITDITSAKSSMIMEDRPSRLVIVDSGTGKLTGAQSRQELLNLISIAAEDYEVTVFYSSEALRQEANTKGISKNAEWFRYEGTAHIVATLMGYFEAYTMSDNYKRKPNDVKAFKRVSGLGIVEYKQTEPGITIGQIRENVLVGFTEHGEVKAYAGIRY